ncbi:Stage III sporulation protein AH [Bacillus cereus Rock1-15]|nr:Stage III sporulation protein AH [Bacillus cereus Rock1-15]
MLKKQTVWLLTMLSLVVVLSVYYVTTPDKMNTASPATGEKIGQEKQGTDKAVTNEAPKETPKKENTSKETTNKETDKKENAKKKQVKKRAMYQFNQVMRISQLYVCKWKISVVNKKQNYKK